MANTFTVKRYTTGQEIHRLKLSDEKSIVWKVTTQAPSFVIMCNDKPYFATDRLTGYKNIEIYGRKSTANQVAEYYNR